MLSNDNYLSSASIGIPRSPIGTCCLDGRHATELLDVACAIKRRDTSRPEARVVPFQFMAPATEAT